jgi:hypothetical protein
MREMNLPPLPSAPESADQRTELFFRRLDSGLMPFRQASNLIIAYLAWPNEEKPRDQYMAASIGLEVAHLERRLVLRSTAE